MTDSLHKLTAALQYTIIKVLGNWPYCSTEKHIGFTFWSQRLLARERNWIFHFSGYTFARYLHVLFCAWNFFGLVDLVRDDSDIKEWYGSSLLDGGFRFRCANLFSSVSDVVLRSWHVDTSPVPADVTKADYRKGAKLRNRGEDVCWQEGTSP